MQDLSKTLIDVNSYYATSINNNLMKSQLNLGTIFKHKRYVILNEFGSKPTAIAKHRQVTHHRKFQMNFQLI